LHPSGAPASGASIGGVKKELRPVHDLQSCDVCGRTILKGERTETYIAEGGQRYSVCELCFARAEQAGWLRESVHGEMSVPPPRPEPRGSLLGRLRRRGGRPEPEPVAEEEVVDHADGYELPEDPLPSELEAAEAAEYPDPAPEPEPQSEPQPQPRRRRDVRHVRAVPTTVEGKIERGLDLFNGSDHSRTISGLARSLGGPWVCALPDDPASSMVTIVVAWELSWYRFQVDLGDEHDPVNLQDKGEEIEQIDAGLREWNAGLDEHGRLVIGVPQQ
jgi:hypothetical protein